MDTRIAAFRALHERGCFVLPNPWDPGSAVYLEHLGFKAVATTSAGIAFSQALHDSGVPLERMLSHVAEIASAVGIPVNADFQNGYADEPEKVAANVARCARTGVAGLSIEDSNSAGALYERALAIERRPEIYFGLGMAQLDMLQRSAAIENLTRACAFDPARLANIPYPEIRDETRRRLRATYGPDWMP